MKFCESSFFQVKKKHGRWVRAFSLGKLLSLDCWNEGAVVPGTCSFCEFRMRPVFYKHIFKIGYICNVPVFDAAFLPILKDFAEITGSRLKIQQDPWHDITATFSSQCGIDITPRKRECVWSSRPPIISASINRLIPTGWIFLLSSVFRMMQNKKQQGCTDQSKSVIPVFVYMIP